MTKLFLITAALTVSPAILFGDPVTFNWYSPGNNPVGYYYVSPYQATNTATGQLVTLYCIDFNHEVAPPNSWEATVQPLTPAALPELQYGNAGIADVWSKYEAAAWLISQLAMVNPNAQDRLRQQAVYQYAAWEIFLDSAHATQFWNSVNAVGGTFAADIASAYAAAVEAVGDDHYTPSGWMVISPAPPGLDGSTQEFLAPMPTPEPATIVLLGSIMLGIGIAARRRRRVCPPIVELVIAKKPDMGRWTAPQ